MDCHSFIHLPDAMLCLPSEERRRSQPGRHGMHTMRYLRLSPLRKCHTAVEEDPQVLERLVVARYDRSSAATGVNDARL